MYQFTDDCLIGIQEIDEEHRQLFELINETVVLLEQTDAAALASATNLIQELKNYAVTHFAHEEEYMQKINDSELPRQKEEHNKFVEKVNSYDISHVDEANAHALMEELLQFLSRWLYRHILSSDMMIGYNASQPKESNPFAFTEEYKTGIDFVDDEHKQLFAIIAETNDLIHNDLLHDKYDKIMDILDQLKEYTVKHFGDEENYMQSIQYEGLEAQHLAHIAFVDKLNEINLEHVDDNQQEYLENLIEYLRSWLVTHILKMDKRIPKVEQ